MERSCFGAAKAGALGWWERWSRACKAWGRDLDQPFWRKQRQGAHPAAALKSKYTLGRVRSGVHGSEAHDGLGAEQSTRTLHSAVRTACTMTTSSGEGGVVLHPAGASTCASGHAGLGVSSGGP